MKKKIKFTAAIVSALLLASCATAIEPNDNTLIQPPDEGLTSNADSMLDSLEELENTEESLDESSQVQAQEALSDEVSQADSDSDSVSQEHPSEGTAQAHLLCVGDNLIHDNIYNEALKLGGGEEYDFSSMYELVEPYVEAADVAIINQETLVNDAYEPQSYPVFSLVTLWSSWALTLFLWRIIMFLIRAQPDLFLHLTIGILRTLCITAHIAARRIPNSCKPWRLTA